jgi:hypothetical protein
MSHSPDDLLQARIEACVNACDGIPTEQLQRCSSTDGNRTAIGLELFKKALADDPDAAWTWHCNLACMIADANGGFGKTSEMHEIANRYAASFMERAFDFCASF